MKIGILGGSFDPIHKGHIYMAKNAIKELNLDKIIFIPAGHSPNKDEKNMTSASDRLKMCKLAVENDDMFQVSDIEIKADNTSFTYITLGKLKEMYQHDQLYFIMGADSIDYFDSWRHPEIISSLANILVVAREGFDLTELRKKAASFKERFNSNITFLVCDKYDLSSTQIRASLKNEQAVTEMLNEKVIEYIKDNHLYLDK